MTPAQSTPIRAVFLDRDGVINDERPGYVQRWEQVHFLEGVMPALARLAESEFKIVVVTNQSAIGRGIVDRVCVDEIHRRMLEQIRQHGGRIDRIYVCPHRPEEGCECRKPAPGLLQQAQSELGVDLSRSYLIGDHTTDLAAARAVGATGILVRTGRGGQAAQELVRGDGSPPVVMEDLAAAVDWILHQEGVRTPQ